MRRTMMSTAVSIAVAVMCSTFGFGQGLLPNDTLYIGHASGTPGQHVMVPLYIKTTDYYQGWTIPLRFGNGLSPLVCDSVSFNGTTMENWAWKSRFVNNNQWDGVQTCGATGIYVWAGDSMLPGYYLALKLFFEINASATPQTVTIDTTTCSFAQGGQQNNFIVVVHTQSWRTIVVPGFVNIGIVGAEELDKKGQEVKAKVLPSIVRRGRSVKIRLAGTDAGQHAISVCDAGGREIDNLVVDAKDELHYSTCKLASGVHFVAVTNGTQTYRAKFIVE